jgi:hypothetical protein
MSYTPSSTVTTRYLIRTARGYFKTTHHHPGGLESVWTPIQSEAQLWVDIDECHLACRRYTDATGESAVVVVTIRPAASSGIAVGASS